MSYMNYRCCWFFAVFVVFRNFFHYLSNTTYWISSKELSFLPLLFGIFTALIFVLLFNIWVARAFQLLRFIGGLKEVLVATIHWQFYDPSLEDRYLIEQIESNFLPSSNSTITSLEERRVTIWIQRTKIFLTRCYWITGIITSHSCFFGIRQKFCWCDYLRYWPRSKAWTIPGSSWSCWIPGNVTVSSPYIALGEPYWWIQG